MLDIALHAIRCLFDRYDAGGVLARAPVIPGALADLQVSIPGALADLQVSITGGPTLRFDTNFLPVVVE